MSPLEAAVDARPWKVRCMHALAKYYEAQSVVEAVQAELEALGLNGSYDVKDKNALQCKCGVWVSFYTWERKTSVTCDDCVRVRAKQMEEIQGDAREEQGLPRKETPVAITPKPAEEIPF